MEIVLELEFKEEGKGLGLGFFYGMVMEGGVMASQVDQRGVMSVLKYFGGEILVKCSRMF